ncbi:hypothetical protein D3C72_249430 [compost metagenome]
MSDLPIRKVIPVAVSVLVLWLSFAILFGAARWMCALPWTQQCILNFFGWFEALILFTWVREPEQIVSSLLAVGAASASVFYLHRQIQQTERHQQQRYESRLRAALATAPLMLSDICEYAAKLANAWKDNARSPRPDYLAHPFVEPAVLTVAFPELDSNLVHELRDLIEASSEEDADPYVAILNLLQVLTARARGFEKDVPNMTGRDRYCWGEAVEALELYSRASNQFDPVRKDEIVRATTPSRDRILNASRSAKIYGHRQIIEMIDRRYPPSLTDADAP